MKAKLKPPVFDRDEYYEASSRLVRWICLILLLVTYPFASDYGLIVLTLIVAIAVYNASRYSRRLQRLSFFNSRLNSLAVDHVCVMAVVVMTGGLASPYYSFFFLLILATIASYGIAGFAFSLSAQACVTVILLRVNPTPVIMSPEFTFIIKIVFLIIFSIVAEQSVRSRDEEYLLESRFTRRVENERQRLLALINSLSNAVLAVDTKGRIYLYNAAALELLNTNRDITGNYINELMPLHDAHGQEVNPWGLMADNARPTNRQDLTYTASDESKIILDLTVSPVHVFGYGRGNKGGYMVVFRDITKQKSLDQERDEFISVTSHELRTPLAIAEANVSTALLPGFAAIEPKAKGLLNEAHKNLVFLSKLIQDLTTLSRAERGDLKLKRELVDCRALTEQLVRDYASQAQAKKLKLVLQADSHSGSVYTSEAELREILQNFLTNAIKYTPNGTVSLTVGQSAGSVRFSVTDTGIGISATDKAKIFEKFYRSEDYRTRQTGGTGLGLYITRKLAEKLGAQIDFSSHLNHGSTFSVTIPSGPPSSHAVTEHAQAAEELAVPSSV